MIQKHSGAGSVPQAATGNALPCIKDTPVSNPLENFKTITVSGAGYLSKEEEEQ
jgi:hypothetical protein